MSATPQSTRQRSDAVASRAAITAAASLLYAEHGIDVPFEDIARTAGVGKSTMYRHFSTRAALFDAILDGLMDDFERIAAAMPRGPDTFLELFDTLIDVQIGHPAVLAAIPKVSPHTPEALARRARLTELFREPLAAAKAAGIVRDELRPEDVRILLVMLSAVVRREYADSDRARARHLAHLSLLR